MNADAFLLCQQRGGIYNASNQVRKVEALKHRRVISVLQRVQGQQLSLIHI